MFCIKLEQRGDFLPIKRNLFTQNMEYNMENDYKREDYYFHKAILRKGSESTQHYHDNYEIYYMKEGKCRYFIDGSFYDVEAGDTVFIPEGVIHKTNYGPDFHSRLLINFSEAYIDSALKDCLNGIDFVYSGRELSEQIKQIFEKIENEYESGDKFVSEALRFYTCELLLILLRNSKGKTVSPGKNSVVDRAIEFINDNYMLDIKLCDVSEKESVTPEHLSREFKKSTGFGFNEYLTLVRLRRAEYMLKNEPGRSIGEIAFTVGFNDSNYFARKFKQITGKTPSKAREFD